LGKQRYSVEKIVIHLERGRGMACPAPDPLRR